MSYASDYANSNMHLEYTITGHDGRWYLYTGNNSGSGYVKFRRVQKDTSPDAINEVTAEWDNENYAPVGVHKVILGNRKVSQEVINQYGGKKSRKASRKSKKKSHKKRPTKKNIKKNKKERTRKH